MKKYLKIILLILLLLCSISNFCYAFELSQEAGHTLNIVMGLAQTLFLVIPAIFIIVNVIRLILYKDEGEEINKKIKKKLIIWLIVLAIGLIYSFLIYPMFLNHPVEEFV